jgi:2-polyprenyl-6-methoxyphenol hydroxylase-like FAD-dependent oxidoreductase
VKSIAVRGAFAITPSRRCSTHEGLSGCSKGTKWLSTTLARPAGVYFDEVTQIEMPSWKAGRVVLVGDACQCVSPLAGQGASLAVAGAYALAEELRAAPADVIGAFARYERRLRPGVERAQKAGRRFARWFVPDNRVHLAVRNAAMRIATNPLSSPVFKRRFAWNNTMRF